MEKPSLAELTAAAAASDGPEFPPRSIGNFGGVDPLGLRQLNFDLMDDVLPGLNNVARHIRPFVIITWAWRRANQLARSRGLEKIPLDRLQNFVDRIEVIYAWSELLKSTKVDLPGRQALWRVLKAKQQLQIRGRCMEETSRRTTILNGPLRSDQLWAGPQDAGLGGAPPEISAALHSHTDGWTCARRLRGTSNETPRSSRLQ